MAPTSVQGEDDGSAVLPVSEYLEARDGERPVGVYALLDRRRNTQYVGYSRNMVLAIKVRLSGGHTAHTMQHPLVCSPERGRIPTVN